MLRRGRDRREVPPVPPLPPVAGIGGEREEPARVDARLAASARAGDVDAFNLLVLRHERAVFGLCLRLLRDVPAAEAAARGAFADAWAGAGGFPGGPVRGWLLRAAVERCRDPRPAGPRRPSSALDGEPPAIVVQPVTAAAGDEAPAIAALRAELVILLERALATLPAEQRLVVLLADVEGCDDGEIAAVTGATPGTIASRLGRGRNRIRHVLGDDPVGAAPFARFARLSRVPPGNDASADPEEGTRPFPAQHLDLDALTAYVDGRLDGGERRAVDDHLAGCADCRHELAELRATVSLLRGLPRYTPRRSFRLDAEDALAPRGGRLIRLLPALAGATRGERHGRAVHPPCDRG